MTKTTVTNANGFTTIKGVKLNYANLTMPRKDLHGNLVRDVQIEVEDAKARKAIQEFIPNFNTETGVFTLRRMAFAGHPRVVGVDEDTRIGNGSTGDVIVRHMVSKRGISFVSLEAVRVTDLLEYTPVDTGLEF